VQNGFAVENSNGTLTIAAITNSVSSGNFCGFWARADGGSEASEVRLSVSGSSADKNSFAGFYSGTTGTLATSTVAVSASKASFNANGLLARGTNGFLRSGGNNLVEMNTNDTFTGDGGVITTPGLK